MDNNNILHEPGDTILIVRKNDLIEFATSFADQILLRLASISPKHEIEQPISQSDAIIYLGKSRQTLIKWRRKGVIEGHTLGGRVFYLKSELLAALNRTTK